MKNYLGKMKNYLKALYEIINLYFKRYTYNDIPNIRKFNIIKNIKIKCHLHFKVRIK